MKTAANEKEASLSAPVLHGVWDRRLNVDLRQHLDVVGVGDVGDVKLVKADEAVTLGNTFAQFVERIDRALEVAQFTVDFAHELVKMQARLALERNRVVKAVHQEAFAAPHPAVHVDPARNVGPVDQLLERIGTLLLERRPLGGAPPDRRTRPGL